MLRTPDELPHESCGLVGIPGLDGLQYAEVVGQGAPVAADVAGVDLSRGGIRDRHEVIEVDEQLVASSVDDSTVEGQIVGDEGVRVAEGLGHPLVCLPDGADGRLGPDAGGQPGRLGLEGDTQTGEVVELARRGVSLVAPAEDVGVEQAPLALGLDHRPHLAPREYEPLCGENLDGLAHGRPARAELGHELVLGRHRTAGGEGAADDAAAELLHETSVDTVDAVAAVLWV